MVRGKISSTPKDLRLVNERTRKVMISKPENDILKNKFSPEGSSLRRQQIMMLNMLRKFDKFCRDNDLVYWLSSGTLLGAVRHGGFIPWDDDMDIEMYKRDYHKLQGLKNKLKCETGIVLQNFETDDEYIAPFPKLRDTRSELKEIHKNDLYYKYRGIYIDIFIRDKSSKFTTLVSHVCQYGSYRLTQIANNGLRKIIKRICYGFLHKGLFPFLDTIDKLTYRSDKFRHVKGSGYYDEVSDEEIFPLKNYSFEDYEFPGPKDADKYLKSLYGDYMKLPSLEDLHPHYGSIIFY